jgi:hypothetical protein
MEMKAKFTENKIGLHKRYIKHEIEVNKLDNKLTTNISIIKTRRFPLIKSFEEKKNNNDFSKLPVNVNISLPQTSLRKNQTIVHSPIKKIHSYALPTNNDSLLYSPKRELIEFNIPGSPSSARINYGTMSSYRLYNNILNENLAMTQTETTETIISNPAYNQKITELQNETNKIKIEHESLKNETKKLIDQIQQLKCNKKSNTNIK